MASKTFNLSMPEELLKELDKQAKKSYSSRSDYIRLAVVNQLRREQGQRRSLDEILDEANAKGRKMGITSEQQVYDIIKGKQEPPKQ